MNCESSNYADGSSTGGRTQHFDSSHHAITSVSSLALIGNASGKKRSVNSGQSPRGIFDKETRRKPLVFAADAGLWGLNRLSPVIDRIYDSCRKEAKVKKPSENVRLRHDSRSLAREASAAPAA